MQKAKVDTIDLGQEAKKRSVDRSARVFTTNRKGEFLGDFTHDTQGMPIRATDSHAGQLGATLTLPVTHFYFRSASLSSIEAPPAHL